VSSATFTFGFGIDERISLKSEVADES
jgi:hypothetical protein